MTRSWSQYSLDLFDFYTNSDDNFVVQACPGAGKTTNIMELWNLDDRSTVYLVFAKANRIEAENKLPLKANSNVYNINALGHRILQNNYGRIQLDDKKCLTIIKNEVTYPHTDSYAVKRDKQWALYKAVSLAKSIAVEPVMDAEDFANMVDMYDLDSYQGMYQDSVRVLEVSDYCRSLIDFNDQIRLPALYDMSMPYWYNILVDEAQDFSPIQALMISKLEGDRYGFVGDRHQSIYAFRGAMNNSLDYLKGYFNCTELPLSITYRCAKGIVGEAQRVFSDIQPWEQSPEGLVIGGIQQYTEEHALYIPVYDTDTIVVCRNNKPLVEKAYELLERGIPCHVKGRDIGEGLINLVKKMQSSNVRMLMTDLEQWKGIELQKAMVKEDDSKIQRIEDKYNSLLIFINKCNMSDSVQVVIDNINSMFEQGKGVCLSTVHKAKGLEATRCYLLEHGLFDAGIKRCKYAWQVEQEKNIKYVAVTRAKGELVYM